MALVVGGSLIASGCRRTEEEVPAAQPNKDESPGTGTREDPIILNEAATGRALTVALGDEFYIQLDSHEPGSGESWITDPWFSGTWESKIIRGDKNSALDIAW